MSSNDPTTLSPAIRELQADFFKKIAIANAIGPEYRQAEIASRAGISPSFYSEMKKLKKPLSINSAVKIATVLDLEIEYVFTKR
tara:strand:- start:2370 stop:2621 length:252 start_codon:yes stop_codon:yes gene_type:complete